MNYRSRDYSCWINIQSYTDTKSTPISILQLPRLGARFSVSITTILIAIASPSLDDERCWGNHRSCPFPLPLCGRSVNHQISRNVFALPRKLVLQFTSWLPSTCQSLALQIRVPVVLRISSRSVAHLCHWLVMKRSSHSL